MWNNVSDKVRNLKPSAIRKYFAVPDDVVTLGIGEPDFTSPDKLMDAARKALDHGNTHYTANAGLIELRRAISDKLIDLYDVHYDPESEIIVTVGASEALYLAASTVLNHGDEMIVITPCFVSYQAAVELAGGVPVEVGCRLEDNFDVDVAAVEAAITPKTRGIMLGFPNNPTGAVASREKLQQICDLAVKHDLAIISDEIYERLIYGVKHINFASLNNAWDRTFIVGGFSKSYAMTGWRLGYVCAPKHLISQLYKIHQYLIMSAPTIAQEIGIVAMRECEPDVERMRKEYDRRRRLIVDGLNTLGLYTFEPKGAFYAFPCIKSTGLTSTEFADRLLAECKVAVIPGCGFGECGEGHVRCSYAVSYDKIAEALNRIEDFVKKVK